MCLCFIWPKCTSFLLSQVVPPDISDPTCHCFYCFTEENFYPHGCDGLWNQLRGLCVAGQTCSAGWLDLGSGSTITSSSMIRCDSSRRTDIPQLQDPMAMCWGSFKARQQGLSEFCRKRQGWIYKLDLTQPFLMNKGQWLCRHHVCGKTCTHSHTRQAGNANTAGRDFV